MKWRRLEDTLIEITLALPYKWTQDLGNVTVSVPLPKGTRGRDCNVVLQKRKLKVSIVVKDRLLL